MNLAFNRQKALTIADHINAFNTKTTNCFVFDL
jgi:hypothetical protein